MWKFCSDSDSIAYDRDLFSFNLFALTNFMLEPCYKHNLWLCFILCLQLPGAFKGGFATFNYLARSEEVLRRGII